MWGFAAFYIIAKEKFGGFRLLVEQNKQLEDATLDIFPFFFLHFIE